MKIISDALIAHPITSERKRNRYLEIGKKIGVSESAVAKWFSGRYVPSKENAEKLRKICGIQIVDGVVVDAKEQET